jgi:hypothetical protein
MHGSLYFKGEQQTAKEEKNEMAFLLGPDS